MSAQENWRTRPATCGHTEMVNGELVWILGQARQAWTEKKFKEEGEARRLAREAAMEDRAAELNQGELVDIK